MHTEQFLESLAEMPIIASVKDDEGLNQALMSDCNVIFVLYGDLLRIGGIVSRAREAGKAAFVHIDLIEGLSQRDVAVDYLVAHTSLSGILSTKVNLIRRAAAKRLPAIQRCFLLDSMSLGNVQRQYAADAACAMEALPGAMPKVIRRLTRMIEAPIITGGLISDKEDVYAVLNAGAVAVSTTNQKIWFL